MPLALFRRHEFGRTDTCTGLGQARPASDRLSDAEVGQQRASVFIHQDIRRLEIAMDDPAAVSIVERIGDLRGQVRGQVGRQRTTGQPVRQRATGHVVHHDIVMVLEGAGVIDGQDVRMAETPGG